MPTREEISEIVIGSLAETLGIERNRISLDSALVADLQAESIDFLDFIFRLEDAFNIEIDRDELFPNEIARDPNAVQQNLITEEGVEQIRRRLSFTDLPSLRAGMDIKTFMTEMLTVRVVVDYIQSKLNQSTALAG